MTEQVIAAFFDSRSDADSAINELVSSGIPRSSIRVMPETDEGISGSGTGGMSGSGTQSRTGIGEIRSGYDTRSDEKGFWASLGDLFLPDEDRYTYAEAMDRGSIMVSVTTDSARADRVEDILEQYGTVDIEERETSWRNEGWAGYPTATAGSTGMAGPMPGETAARIGVDDGSPGQTGLAGVRRDETDRELDPDEMARRAGNPGMSTSSMDGSGMGERSSALQGDMPGTRHGEDDEVIPIVEEQLRIGKRQMRQGRVKVRSYVIETPVEEQVSLRQEHVHVERRPATGAVDMNPDALFRERTIEAEEHGEEAVASKEARVTEELVLRKDVENRTQTVSDTVRRTEVEVDDDRTDRTVTGGSSDPLTRR
jgi:uncharacterized protein (TIGR02271 family)